MNTRPRANAHEQERKRDGTGEELDTLGESSHTVAQAFEVSDSKERSLAHGNWRGYVSRDLLICIPRLLES